MRFWGKNRAAVANSGTRDDALSVYPLLSGIDMSEGFGTNAGVPGKFSPTANSIGDLRTVLNDMVGKTNNRESIPSPFSQTEAFWITLTFYPVEGVDIIQQWRGALCLAVLYPLLFNEPHRLAWKQGADRTNNAFIELVEHCKGNHNTRLWALCAQDAGRTYPILYCDDRCGVVPVAYGIEKRTCTLPWLTYRNAEDMAIASEKADMDNVGLFADPLKCLSLGQLRLLLEGVRKLRGSLPLLKMQPAVNPAASLEPEANPEGGRTNQKDSTEIAVAVTAFEAEIRDKIEDYQQNNPFAELERTLLKALMLRNVLDCGLHVVYPQRERSEQDAATEGTQAEATVSPSAQPGTTQQVPPIRRPQLCSFAKDICQGIDKLVVLNGQIVGYLDAEDVLCSINPSMLELNHDYKNIREKLTVQANRFASLERYQKERLLANFPNAAILRYENGAADQDMLAQPLAMEWVPVRALDNEVDLASPEQALAAPSVFAALALVVFSKKETDTIFSQQLMYTQSNTPLKYGHKEDHQYLHLQEVKGLSDSKWSWYYLFLPAGLFGIDILLTYGRVALDCSVVPLPSSEGIQATFTVQDAGLLYSISHTYQGSELLPFEPPKLPCMALWADVQDTRPDRENAWRLHYLFVCFIYDTDSLDFDVHAYGQSGKEVSNDCREGQTHSDGPLTLWWRNHCFTEAPGYAVFTHNNRSCGAIILQHLHGNTATEVLYRGVKKIKLAIDFGTTCTLAYIQTDPTVPASPAVLDDSHLTWLVNGVEGNLYATRYFFSRTLCLVNKEKPAVLSVIRRFGCAIAAGRDVTDNVHIDGNIFFLNESNAYVDRNVLVRGGFKILFGSSPRFSTLTVEQYQADTKLFLKQLLHMYFLLCRKRDGVEVDVYFAVPLALERDDRMKLLKVFREITQGVAQAAGYVLGTDVHVYTTTESLAVGAFFNGKTQLFNTNPKGILAMDIGGGSTDYSLWRRTTESPSAYRCASNRLAGHEIFSRFLISSLGRKYAKDKFILALRDANGINAVDTTNLANLVDQLDTMLQPKTVDNTEVDRLTDQLFLQYPEAMKNAFRDNRCKILMEVISLEIGLLCWVGGLLYMGYLQHGKSFTTHEHIMLCMAGNGTNYYYLLEDRRQKALLTVFEEIGIPITLYHTQPEELKTEVARGMLMGEDIFSEDEDLCQPEVTEIADGLIQGSMMAFLRKYSEIFSGAAFLDEVAIKLAERLQTDRHILGLEHYLRTSMTDLDLLNQNLVAFKEGLLDTIFESPWAVTVDKNQ